MPGIVGRTTTRLAPAKVNLFLHVGPPGSDGYHPVASLMLFADVGDRLTLAPCATQELDVTGEFAPDLAGAPRDGNLVWRAARALLARVGTPERGFRLTLDKALPVAAGLGGGSSDAGAALVLLRDAFAPDLSDAELEAIAGQLGADGPACLRARPVVGTGRGDVLAAPPTLPVLHAVLVNPRSPSPTGAVYRAYDAGRPTAADLPSLPAGLDSEALIAWAAPLRNDLEAPAAALSPDVARTLAVVRQAPDAALVRLSGSGATVFALAKDARAQARLARWTAAEAPGCWVRACRLGGPWS